MQRMCNQDSTLTNRILFTDEAILAIWNFQRAQHTWAEKNRHCVVQNKYRREFNMNATQLRVLNNKLIFFYRYTLRERFIWNFWKLFYRNCWKVWVYTWEEIYGLCDGLSIHFGSDVMQYLKNIPIDGYNAECHRVACSISRFEFLSVGFLSVGLFENFGVQNVDIQRKYSADANYRQV